MPDPAATPAVGATRPAKRPTRTKARKRAIDILFEAELRGGDPLSTLAERTADGEPPVREFTTELVTGVCEHQAHIDHRIIDHLATGWELDRLPRVDRAILRIATFEIDYTEVPAKVAAAEAVALAEELSTDDSASFVNGVLGSITATARPEGPPTEVSQTEVSQTEPAQTEGS